MKYPQLFAGGPEPLPSQQVMHIAEGSWLDAAGDWIIKGTSFLSAVPIQVWAAVFAIVLSLIATQFIKKLFPPAFLAALVGRSEALYRSLLMLISFLIGFTTCYTLWPVESVFRIFASLFFGLSPPYIYKWLSATVAKRFPSLSAWMSGYPDLITGEEDEDITENGVNALKCPTKQT